MACHSRNQNCKPQDSAGAHKKNTLANVECFSSSRSDMNPMSQDPSIYSTPLSCSKTLRVVYCWCDDVVAVRAELHAVQMYWQSRQFQRRKRREHANEQSVLTKNKAWKMINEEFEIIHEDALGRKTVHLSFVTLFVPQNFILRAKSKRQDLNTD